MYAFVDAQDVIIAFEPVGPFQQNQSFIGCKRTGQAALVDCGAPPNAFLRFAKENGFRIENLYLTHAHIDHVAGLGPARAALPDAPLHLHPLDRPLYEAVPRQAQLYGFPVPPLPPIDVWYEDDAVIAVGDLRFEVIHTPGHAPGHVCLYERTQACVIGGDLLFRQGIGRTDLPGADPNAMVESLRKILTLDDAVQVLPGHGEPTTIGFERKANPFLQGI